MSYQPVTDGQMRCAKKIAVEKRISLECFQQALDSGGFARYLESLRYGGIVPPRCGRIHLLPGIEVILDQRWDEAVNSAAPNTPAECNVRKVGDQYLPIEKGRVIGDYIALNFSYGNGWQAALDWAKSQKLEKTTPREVFAVASQHQILDKILGQNPMYMVSTEECTLQGHQKACYVWWHDAKREAGLRWVGYLADGFGWFLFRKPSVLTT